MFDVDLDWNQMRIGRWSELNVDSVCQEHELMRDAVVNETSANSVQHLAELLWGCPS